MKSVVQLKTATPPILTCLHRYAMHCWQVTLALTCFGLLPAAQAVVPAPDGGYPGGNTAEGTSALLSLTTGTFNTAVGLFSLLSLTDGNFNTGVGAGTLLANTADLNTAIGAGALFSNSTGTGNTANGTFALFVNTAGEFNTATGFDALISNTEGGSNTATGAGSLSSNTTGSNNTATGSNALFGNTTGSLNTAIGFQALFSNTEGNFNTAMGATALSQATGSENIGVGNAAGILVTAAENVICIGALGADQSNSCYIGNIFGKEVALDAVPVLVDSLGKLGVQISSRKFKKDIQPMDKASEAILALKPVTFHYKSEKTNKPQFGLIAEDVAEVNPNLVVRDEKGELLTVRYDQVNAMLLNEFLKEHKKVEEQQATIAQLKKDFQMASTQQQKEIQLLSAQLKEQAAEIQKVAAQLQLNRSAQRTVVVESP
jgi:Chaperone of endosialidase